ncbi:RmlC-like cupin domain-containing protein [Dendryphion nanum]|uniref:RmlC-like cupin domain-containing protein n=1 Tax=Dendryphion nanum TaxID=256645 RepID=A0A9P9D1A0_9PLEO|nr:RmlC-like cupin domain-containing protein [Dendryphion nanum]
MPSFLHTFVATLAIGAVNALPQPQVASTLSSSPPSPTPIDNTALIASLKTDPTIISRYRRLLTTNGGQQLLPEAELAKATVFDLEESMYPIPGAQGGKTFTTSPENLPILLDTSLSVSLTTIGPCGILLPHVHPRAHEFFTVIDGTVSFGYTLEIGLLKSPTAPNPEIRGTLKKYAGTLFPHGSVHYQINTSEKCERATVLIALSSDDPGTTTVLQSPKALVNGTASMADPFGFEAVRGLVTPEVAAIVDKCLTRCGRA